MYDRLEGLINKEFLNKLNKKKILLVGVGGVGSFCFEVLIRSGIKNITIIDYDTYEESNLNRQLHVNINNIGKSKVEVLKEHASLINKDINVEAIFEKINSTSAIDFKMYDYIIDACDSIDAKVYLIKNALENNCKVISSMGVGNRLDANKLSIMKLKNTNNDPLAKKLRKALKENNISLDINCVCSSELPKKINPVSSYIGVSAYAGILLADKVIKDLIEL